MISEKTDRAPRPARAAGLFVDAGVEQQRDREQGRGFEREEQEQVFFGQDVETDQREGGQSGRGQRDQKNDARKRFPNLLFEHDCLFFPRRAQTRTG